jgi:hypothetical protein
MTLPIKHSRIIKISFRTIIGILVVFIATLVPIESRAQVDVDRVQRIFLPNPISIPADRDGAFRVYFPYNNPTNESMNDVVAELRVEGSGFVIVPSEIFDLYSSNSGQPISCKELKDVPKFQINPMLGSSASVVYGLQTANNPAAFSGEAVGALNPGASGCIQVTMAIDPSIIVGQEAAVYMNWYVKGELDKNKLPPIGIYNIKAVKGNSNSEECDVNQELYDGICVSVCRLGQIRDAFGACVDQSTINQGLSSANSFDRDAQVFNIYLWLMMIFSTLLGVSICILIYSLIIYRRLRH